MMRNRPTVATEGLVEGESLVMEHRRRRPRVKVLQLMLTLTTIVGMMVSQSFFSTSLHSEGTQTQSKTHNQRRLEFIHIPKTGGTTVEAVAAEWNTTWGRCHFKYDKPCQPKEPPLDIRTGCNRWHTPTPYWVHSTWNPFRNADLFTIVRNPYSRTLSQYYWAIHAYRSKLEKGIEIPPKQRRNYSLEIWNDPQHLNKEVHDMLREWEKDARRPKYAEHKPGNRAYYRNDCHLVPQYDYVFHPNGTQLVSKTIKFENMHAEFSQLMQDYNLPMTLPSHDVREAISRTLTVSDLTVHNLKLIERVYAKDFEVFGYEKLSSKKQAE